MPVSTILIAFEKYKSFVDRSVKRAKRDNEKAMLVRVGLTSISIHRS